MLHNSRIMPKPAAPDYPAHLPDFCNLGVTLRIFLGAEGLGAGDCLAARRACARGVGGLCGAVGGAATGAVADTGAAVPGATLARGAALSMGCGGSRRVVSGCQRRRQDNDDALVWRCDIAVWLARRSECAGLGRPAVGLFPHARPGAVARADRGALAGVAGAHPARIFCSTA